MDYEVVGNIYKVPLLDIFVDLEFNCRGRFTPQEVYSLGQAIKQEGQLQPLTIQPIEDVPVSERPKPCPWKFRLIAGHRRYMAIDKWTGHDWAKCVVEKGLSYQQARVLNFTENLQRKDLNMLEEAKALVRAWPRYDAKVISKLIGEPKRWVQARLDLLMLPDYVQHKASLPRSQGGLSQYDIETLAQLPENEIEPVFQKLVTTKGKRGASPVVARRQGWRDRCRGKTEIKKQITRLYQSQCISEMSDDIRDAVVSTLSWVIKGIESCEFMENRLDYPPGSVIVDENDRVIGIRDSEGNEMKF